MSCTNCYNGCVEKTPDKCVKYTGVDIPSLEIETGDSLYVITGKITTFLMSALNGTGIKPIIDESFICELISENLPVCVECDGFTLNDILTAIIKSVCQLQTEITNVSEVVASINSVYTIGCLTGIINDNDTHEVVQATINKVCELSLALAALALDLTTNYVSIDNIDTYIENYINNAPGSNLINAKMIPYVALPYFGSLINFDITGAGIGNWIDIYLCNGLNGTPDLRGRALVGTTDMGNPPMNPAVDPAVSGNPTYTISSTHGANQITLNSNEIPSHAHTIVINDSESHYHYMAVGGSNNNINSTNSLYDGTNPIRNEQGLCSRAANQASDAFDYELVSWPGTINAGKTSNDGIHTHTATINQTGGGLPHSNIQPVKGSYFIMYIP